MVIMYFEVNSNFSIYELPDEFRKCKDAVYKT